MSEEQHNNTAFMKNVRNTHKYFTLMLRIPKTFKDNILSRMEICTNLKINCIPLRATSLCSLRSTTTTRAICFMVAVVGKYCSALCPDALPPAGLFYYAWIFNKTNLLPCLLVQCGIIVFQMEYGKQLKLLPLVPSVLL